MVFQTPKPRPAGRPSHRVITRCVIFLTSFLAPFCAHAFWAAIPLNPTNIDSTAPFIRIVSQNFGTNNSSIDFSVFVFVEKKTQEDLVSAYLDIKDANAKIVASSLVQPTKLPKGANPTAIPSTWTDHCLLFRFTVNSSYITHSTFSLNFSEGPVGSPMGGTGGVAYWFNLNEFHQANAKSSH